MHAHTYTYTLFSPNRTYAHMHMHAHNKTHMHAHKHVHKTIKQRSNEYTLIRTNTRTSTFFRTRSQELHNFTPFLDFFPKRQTLFASGLRKMHLVEVGGKTGSGNFFSLLRENEQGRQSGSGSASCVCGSMQCAISTTLLL